MSEDYEKTVEKEIKEAKHHEGIAGKIFWGLLLITIGGLLLAKNFGLVEVNWSGIWRLWPLFIIFSGLSVLNFKNIIWKILSSIFAVLTVAFIAFVAIGGVDILNINQSYKESFEIVQVESTKIKSADITVKAGASNVKISTANQIAAADVKLTSNFAELDTKSTVVGDIQEIDFSMESRDFWFGSFKNDWDIKLSQSLPISFKLDIGASDIDADLSNGIFESIDLDMGASDLNLIIGDKQKLADLSIDSGASSIKIFVPKSSGVKLNIDEGLSSKELDGLISVGEGIYQTEGYEAAENKVNILAKVGVSSFTIEKY